MRQPSGLAGTVQAAFYERSMSKYGVKMLFTALDERFTGHRPVSNMLVYTPSTTPVNVGARASAPGEILHNPLAPRKTHHGLGVRSKYFAAEIAALVSM